MLNPLLYKFIYIYKLASFHVGCRIYTQNQSALVYFFKDFKKSIKKLITLKPTMISMMAIKSIE